MIGILINNKDKLISQEYTMSEINENEQIDDLEILEKPIKKTSKNPAPKVVIKKKIVVKTPTPPQSEEEDEEDPKEEPETPKPKSKRVRTQKQIDAFNKCLAIKQANAKKRMDEAKRLAEEERKALEEKVVKKAISIKKKQIKKQVALDEISDDDEPIEAIREKVKKAAAAPVPPKPKPAFNFI